MKSLKKSFLTGLTVLFSIVVFGQDKSEVLLTVENQPITVAEFEAIYNKNNTQSKNAEDKSVEEYLELFINFKLKVEEAQALGLDTVPSFKNELEGYIEQLKEPYLIDQAYNEALIQEAYERMKYDVEASHILVRVGEDAKPADTLKAYNKIKAIKTQIEAGDDFNKVAKEKSEDPSAKDNEGKLGYFTVFRMVYPFETAAYSTAEGEISDILRTDYGYHILKVTEKREAIGQIRAAHIMVKSADMHDNKKQVNAEQKINDIYDRLQSSDSFESLATAYSDDKASARRGGELPWFGAGRMVPEFENTVYSLSEGEFSKPFQTPYGWHIVKLIERKGIGSLDEVKGQIEQKISKDKRGSNSQSVLVAKLKDAYKVKTWKKSKEAFYDLLGEEALEGKWKLPEGKYAKKILRLHDKEFGKNKITYKQQDFAKYIHRNQRGSTYASTNQMVDALFNQFVEDKVIEYEASILEKKYPEYRNLVREYRDGILLFELMDQKVWSKAIRDTAGLEAFYAEHKENFMWNERAKATIYTCDSRENAEQVVEMLKAGTADSTIISKLNTDSQLGVSLKSGRYEKGKTSDFEPFEWEEGITEIKSIGDNFVVAHVEELMAPSMKKIEEARGLITAAYQEYLEDQWIKELRKKYAYEVNEEALKLVNIQ